MHCIQPKQDNPPISFPSLEFPVSWSEWENEVSDWWSPELLLQSASHMEDTWSYITAFIGPGERAIRGLCQDSLLIFPPYSVSPVSLLPFLHSAEGLSDKKVQKWPTCCCFAPVCVCYDGLQTWLCWPVGELPADKETWLTGTPARRMASLLWKRKVIETMGLCRDKL